MTDLEWLRSLYRNPMEIFANCLRSVITAPPGRELIWADYNAIETRVLFWVADHEDGVEAFRQGRDLYCEMASAIYKREIIKEDKFERQLGKTCILGAGYQMGGPKFQLTCKNQGIAIDEDMAKLAIKAYRETHSPVVQLWWNLEKAAIAAVRGKGKRFKINHTIWWTDSNFLFCELPSGRKLSYYGPEIHYKNTPWGEKRPSLHHWGVNGVTKKWDLGATYGGMLTENIVQAISRDLLASAMLRIEGPVYEIILTIHDEIIAEVDEKKGDLKEFEKLMAEVPPWAKGCPVRVEGQRGLRYKK